MHSAQQTNLLSVSHTEAIDLNLEEILAKAIENNINLQIAKANTKEAKWKFWEKIAKLQLPIDSAKISRDANRVFA